MDQSRFLEAPFIRMLRMRSASLKIINKTWSPISKKIRKTKNDIENQNFTIYEAIFIIEH